MDHLPIFLDLRGRAAAVVGGGAAATGYAEMLFDAGAKLKVFAAVLTAEFSAHVETKRLNHVAREPNGPDELADAALCVIATGDAALDRRAHAIAKAANIPAYVEAHPELSDFLLPAVVDRGSLTVAVSAGRDAAILGERLAARIQAPPSWTASARRSPRASRTPSRAAVSGGARSKGPSANSHWRATRRMRSHCSKPRWLAKALRNSARSISSARDRATPTFSPSVRSG
jgi:siroheme synthase-like protein